MSIYDNAGVVLIPSGYKAASTDNLYSVLPANGNGDFNATRGSTATRVNKDGFIESVATNVPRLDYPLIDGVVQDCPALLLEPSRTNSQPYSEDLSQSPTRYSYGGITVTSNAIVSPDGSQTADKIVETASTARHELYGNLISYSGTSSISFFAKAAERQFISVFIGGDPAVGGATFDVLNGFITVTSGSTNANIEDFGNGWFRCSFTSTKVATSNVYYCLRTNGDAVNVQTYTGDGSSGMYIWGVQSEVSNSYPTSYIPTLTSATATRSADVCNGSGTSAEFNNSEGVLYYESKIHSLTGDKAISVSSGSYDDSVSIGVYGGVFQSRIRKDGNFVSFISPSGVNLLNNNKIAILYSASSIKIFVNGVLKSNVSGVTYSAILSKISFTRADSADFYYGNTKQLMNFKTALTDSELETLTSWDSFNAMATGQLYTIE